MRKYLVEHTYKIPDAVNPRYYSILSFKVPAPAKAEDKPVILATLHNAQRSIFLTFAKVDNLDKIFNLDRIDTTLKEDLKARLQSAESLRAIREKLDREALEEFEKLSPPS